MIYFPAFSMLARQRAGLSRWRKQRRWHYLSSMSHHFCLRGAAAICQQRRLAGEHFHIRRCRPLPFLPFLHFFAADFIDTQAACRRAALTLIIIDFAASRRHAYRKRRVDAQFRRPSPDAVNTVRSCAHDARHRAMGAQQSMAMPEECAYCAESPRRHASIGTHRQHARPSLSRKSSAMRFSGSAVPAHWRE